jgi:hypothetical protein
VNTSTDYDTNGFPGYLKADGVDDFLQTNSIDFNTVTSDGLPRRNLLVNPTQFDAAVWESSINGTGVAATVTADQGTAPDGTNTADRIQFNLGGGTTTSDITRRRQSYVTPATAHTFSLYLRSFDGVSSYNMHIVGADGATTNIVVTGAWQRFTVTANGPGGSVGYAVGLRGGQTPANSNTADVLAWGAQLETGSTATAFQNIGTDKVTVFAGVRKLSDASYPLVVELSANANSNSGAFNIIASGAVSGSAGWSYLSRGTASAQAQVGSGYASPITNLLTGLGNISGDQSTLRVNGTQVATSSTDQGTGNFGNYPAYFFRRGGTTLPFNGYEYGNIAVGKLLTADQLTALETYMNGLTKAY